MSMLCFAAISATNASCPAASKLNTWLETFRCRVTSPSTIATATDKLTDSAMPRISMCTFLLANSMAGAERPCVSFPNHTAAGPPPPTRPPPTIFKMAWSSSRKLAGLDDGQLRVERAVTVTKAAGAAAGVLLTSRITTRRAGAQIAVVRVAPDGPCALAVMAGDVLIGVNHLGDGGAPDLNGSEHDLEAVVAELRQASTLRLRVLRHM